MNVVCEIFENIMKMTMSEMTGRRVNSYNILGNEHTTCPLVFIHCRTNESTGEQESVKWRSVIRWLYCVQHTPSKVQCLGTRALADRRKNSTPSDLLTYWY